VPATFYGLNAQALFKRPPSEWDEQLDRLAATGVGVVRFDTEWEAIEPRPPLDGVHTYDWARMDAIVSALARHGLQALPIIDYSARWAAPPPEPGLYGAAPPEPAAYATFAQAVASRFGTEGAFWTEHPELPRLPIGQYEIWNEENTTEYFEGADPATYAALYAASRDAIHAVDPSAMVLVGGVLATNVINPFGWLESFLAALPQHGQEIDALGWHPYYSFFSDAIASLQALRQVMSSMGLDPPVDVTEANYIDGIGPPSLLGELATTLPMSDCHITGMIAYHWSSVTPGKADPFAIADAGGNLKPVGMAFSSAVLEAESRGVPVPPPICESAPTVASAGAPERGRVHRPRRSGGRRTPGRRTHPRSKHRDAEVKRARAVREPF